MASIFICYAREDDPEGDPNTVIKRLTAALDADHRDYWIDRTSTIPVKEWPKQVAENIEAADTFLYVMSPAALRSEACNEELQHALEFKKRIVPIVIADVDAEHVDIRVRLAQWILFRKNDDFDAAFQKLLFALDTDLGYWDQSARLLVRAREWAAKPHDRSLLLRGTELAEAERWQDEGLRKEPTPTSLHNQYITTSRSAATARRTRVLLSVILSVALVATGSSVAAFTINQQNFTITQQNQLLRAQVLAGEANSALVNNQIDQALLLSIEGVHHTPNFDTRNALINALEFSPHLQTVVQSDTTRGSSPEEVNLDETGKTLMTADIDGHITLWGTATWRARQTLDGHKLLLDAALSADGKLVVAGINGVGLIVWNATTGQQIAQLEHKPLATRPVLGEFPKEDLTTPNLAFAPDGNTLAVWDCTDPQCDHGAITMWDVGARSVLAHLPMDYDASSITVAFGPSGKQLATTECANGRCQLVVWDMGTYVRSATVPLPQGTGEGAVFSPDGSLIAVHGCAGEPCLEGLVQFWDVRSGQWSGAPLLEPAGAVDKVAFSPDSHTLLTGAGAGTLRLWDVPSRTTISAPLPGHSDSVSALAFSPDGQHFASASHNDFKVLWWSTHPYTPASLPLGDGVEGGSQVVFGPSGNVLVTGNCQGQILLWDAHSGQLATPPVPLPGESATCVTSLAISRDGKLLGAGMFDGNAIVVDINSGQVYRYSASKPQAPSIDVTSIKFSSDGRYMIFKTFLNSGVYLVDLSAHNIIQQFTNTSAALVGGAFSPDSRVLAVSQADNSIIFWDPELNRYAGHRLAGGHVPAGGLAFSPDGHTLATLGQDGEVMLWDLQQYRVAAQLSLPQGSGSGDLGVAFSPDPHGHTLVAHEGRAIAFWDVASRQLLIHPLLDPTTILNISFSPDGQLLAEAETNGPVLVRNATVDGWLMQACRIAHRNFTAREWNTFFGSEQYHKTCDAYPALEGPGTATPSP